MEKGLSIRVAPIVAVIDENRPGSNGGEHESLPAGPAGGKLTGARRFDRYERVMKFIPKGTGTRAVVRRMARGWVLVEFGQKPSA